MDSQLACATFATVIPVLLVAGYLSVDIPEMAARNRDTASGKSMQRTIFITMSAASVGEFAALIGTAVPDAPRVFVYVGLTGAIAAMTGFLAVNAVRLSPPARSTPNVEDPEAPEQVGRDDDADHPPGAGP